MAKEEKPKAEGDDELSPEELDQVSGGIMMPPGIAPAASVVKAPLLQTPTLQAQLPALIKPTLK